MHSAAQAYARTAQATANPRELESQLLLRAAARLQDVREGRISEARDVVSALRYNRKLWMIFGQAVSRDDNPLPRDMRTNLFNLAAFVIERSFQLEMKHEPAKVEALVNINREIAAGLRSAAAAMAAPAPVAELRTASAG